MSITVPPGAALLLGLIGSVEAPKGYGTLFANRQDRLAKPLMAMTLDQVIAAGPTWSKWGPPGSSAAGRYQFMNATLKGLKAELKLTGRELFDAELQNRLGYHLLKRRGYAQFIAGTINAVEFGKRLAQEWASFPVLAATKGDHRQVTRGQSYYAGDGVNKALLAPERIETALAAVLSREAEAKVAPTAAKPQAPPKPPAPPAAPIPVTVDLEPAPGWREVLAAILSFFTKR